VNFDYFASAFRRVLVKLIDWGQVVASGLPHFFDTLYRLVALGYWLVSGIAPAGCE
jgi:hypothetical protein